ERLLAIIKIGILCITKENIGAPWVNFEAGALASSVAEESRVCPYCWGLKVTDFSDPLGSFNGVEANEIGTKKLVVSLNNALGMPVSPPNLAKTFEKLWPELGGALGEIKEPTPGNLPPRTPESLLTE